LVHGISKNLIVLFLGANCFLGAAQSPYSVLGISEDASEDTLKKAYLQKVKETHPDTSSLSASEAQKRFKEIQAAWEEIQKRKPTKHLGTQEREQARKDAESHLEKAWEKGQFSAKTIESLPRKQAAQRPSPLARVSGRGPKEEGEWEALTSFIRKHQADILQQTSQPQDILSLISAVEDYQNLLGTAARDLREGLLEPFEDHLIERASSPETFLKAVMGRMERIPPSDELRKKALEKMRAQAALTLYSTLEEVPKSLARELLEEKFETIRKNPVRAHELGFLIPTFQSWLSPKDNLTLLGKLLENLESLPPSARKSGGVRDIQNRAERAAERLFQKYPELKTPFLGKASIWNRFFGTSTRCEVILGRLAAKTPTASSGFRPGAKSPSE